MTKLSQMKITLWQVCNKENKAEKAVFLHVWITPQINQKEKISWKIKRKSLYPVYTTNHKLRN